MGQIDGVLAGQIEQAAGAGDEYVKPLARAWICGFMPTPPKITALFSGRSRA